ncbi:MAG: hypothetical protein WBK94_03010 [Tenuifilaceae bacterium]
MAWNPSPQVRVARDAAATLGRLAKSPVIQVAIVYITADGRLGTVTYGQTKALCAEAKALGDELYDAAMNFYRQPDDRDFASTDDY